MVAACSARRRRNEPEAFLYAFDLLELGGTDLRPEPIEVRKALASILRKAQHGVRLNEHLEHDCGLTGLPAHLQDGTGRNCLQATGALSIRTLAGLASSSRTQPRRRSAGAAEEDWGR
jgi:hypothetical protein